MPDLADMILGHLKSKAIERQLTPQEKRIVQYHRQNADNPGRDPEGRPVTVYSNTIPVPTGPYAGKHVTVPGYFDGQMHDDPQAIFQRWAGEIAQNRWPLYDDPQVGDARAKLIHGIMDIESGQR